MTDRFLVMGDNHGDTESLRRVREDIRGEAIDLAIHVGDFTSA
ncbi:MAG: metallophosphoesterase [Halodesulfurarchaeum sp.]